MSTLEIDFKRVQIKSTLSLIELYTRCIDKESFLKEFPWFAQKFASTSWENIRDKVIAAQMKGLHERVNVLQKEYDNLRLNSNAIPMEEGSFNGKTFSVIGMKRARQEKPPKSNKMKIILTVPISINE